MTALLARADCKDAIFTGTISHLSIDFTQSEESTFSREEQRGEVDLIGAKNENAIGRIRAACASCWIAKKPCSSDYPCARFCSTMKLDIVNFFRIIDRNLPFLGVGIISWLIRWSSQMHKTFTRMYQKLREGS